MPIHDLPPDCLPWFKERGCPNGRPGKWLAVVREIKDRRMDMVLDPLREANGGRVRFRAKQPRERNFPEGGD